MLKKVLSFQNRVNVLGHDPAWAQLPVGPSLEHFSGHASLHLF